MGGAWPSDGEAWLAEVFLSSAFITSIFVLQFTIYLEQANMSHSPPQDISIAIIETAYSHIPPRSFVSMV